MEVKEYIDKNGINAYKKWFNSLDSISAAKVTVAKARLELGNTSSIKWFSGIGELGAWLQSVSVSRGQATDYFIRWWN